MPNQFVSQFNSSKVTVQNAITDAHPSACRHFKTLEKFKA